MIFESLLLPVWKTRDYSLDIAKLSGSYVIYLKRLGKFYMKNEHGIKVKFSARDAEEDALFTRMYREKKKLSTGGFTVSSE